jgi:hypothetical protein
MTYCPKCGKQNEDGAEFCNKCGASLTGAKRKEREECEECAGSSRSSSIIWGAIVIFIGLWIIVDLGLSNIPGFSWLGNLEFWWIFPVIIGIAIIIAGIRIMTKKKG